MLENRSPREVSRSPTPGLPIIEDEAGVAKKREADELPNLTRKPNPEEEVAEERGRERELIRERAESIYEMRVI